MLSNMAIDHPKLEYLRFLQPMASGFLIYAAIKFIQLFIHKTYHWVLLIATSLVGILLGSPWLIPVMLLIGGITSSYIKNKETLKRPEPIKQIRWDNLLVFIGIFIGMAIIGVLTQNRFFLLFENNYRYGSMVFGGGHVLIPLMFNQFVEYKQYMIASDFLAGVGLLQAMPGPVFSIASFAGAMSTKEFGILGQLLGWFVSSVAIFLPGILLIFFVYPIWNQLKNYTPVKNAIEGINAASAGLVITSAYLLFLPVEVNEENMLILLATLFLLLTTKVPSPLIVLGCIAMGFII
jgi:chromate transporter